jgi:hypothetical protein
MPKLYLTLLLIGCISLSAYSQKVTISGSVIDTSENKPIQNAVVSILRPVDSLLLKFVRTKSDGTFSIPNLKSSKNIVLITYPGYADYADSTKDVGVADVKLGVIPLTQKSQLLETVIVRQQVAAIRMKGDTLEYKADSFAVREGATVDELLKRLPGITVNGKGEITAQGQKINKVIVDGEEFFSDDPAVVIKNLQANAVDKVQVFDKKSDQAEFTGIDDGKSSKTINLTLKDDKKKGFFAKGTVGGGTNGTFDNDLMANAFKGSKKIAAFGIMSNTGRQDLNWNESTQFGEGTNLQYDEESGGMSMSWGGGEDYTSGMNVEEGLPKAWTGGFHFSNKWNADKEKVNANYRFFKNNQRADKQTISQYILPDTQFFNTSSRQAFSTYKRHFAKGVYDFAIDSSSSLKITVNGNSIESENASRMTSAALNADSGRVNNNERTANSQSSKQSLNTSALWRKKFPRKGRTLSVNLDQQASELSSDGFLRSLTDYYGAAGQTDSSELIDQKKLNRQNNFGLQTTVVYTEPLSKSVFLSVNYGYNFRKSESFRTALDNDGNGYDKRDSSLSNDFRYNFNVQSAGLDFKYNKKKLTVTVGSGINYSAFHQTDLLNDTALGYSFLNYFPKLSLRWAPTQQKGFQFNYNGRTNQPSLDQLQPVRENSDPLNIRVGNPELRQEFSHNLNFSIYDYKVLKSRGYYFAIRSMIQDNAISNSLNTDLGGKTTYQAINVDGNYFVNVYASYQFKPKKLGVNIDFGPDITYTRNSNRVNGLSNINYNANYGFRGMIAKWGEKRNFYFVPQVGYNYSKNSLRPDVITKYFSSSSEASVWTQLPYKFEFSTSAYINLRQKTDVFANNRNSTKWDASVAKKFLKKDNLELKLSVFDILDQNIGFSRTTNSNVITQESYQNLRRFWMLSLQFNITKQ